MKVNDCEPDALTTDPLTHAPPPLQLMINFCHLRIYFCLLRKCCGSIRLLVHRVCVWSLVCDMTCYLVQSVHSKFGTIQFSRLKVCLFYMSVLFVSLEPLTYLLYIQSTIGVCMLLCSSMLPW